METTQTNVERKLCTGIMDAIWECNRVFLVSGGLSEEELIDVRIRDFEFAEQLAGIIHSMITNRKYSELRMCRWFENVEFTYNIRLAATLFKSQMSKNGKR